MAMVQRSKEELEVIQALDLEDKFRLKEQKTFKGNAEMLARMQYMERMYRIGKPVISDEEWDKLVSQTGYEESLDEITSPNGRTWLKFQTPLLSLKKITTYDELEDYVSKFPENQKFIVEPKLDGLTFNAVYEFDGNDMYKLSAISSRGDGLNGLILHKDALAEVCRVGLPDFLYINGGEKKYGNRFEIRGEAVVDRNDFKGLVLRSVIAGIFNRKIPSSKKYMINNFSQENCKLWGVIGGQRSKYREAKIEDGNIYRFNFYDKQWEKYETEDMRDEETVYFVSFGISTENGNIDDYEEISSICGLYGFQDIEDENIQKMFDIVDSSEKIKEIVDFAYGCKDSKRDMNMPRIKNQCKFAIDGIVIKPVGSNKDTQKSEPVYKNGKIIVPHDPADQVAIKLQGEKYKTRIKKINYMETEIGNYTCNAEIEPVIVETGALVRNVSLNNQDWLKLPENQWIKEGVECWVTVLNDVRPYIMPME